LIDFFMLPKITADRSGGQAREFCQELRPSLERSQRSTSVISAAANSSFI
jgi:hypothetical protein